MDCQYFVFLAAETVEFRISTSLQKTLVILSNIWLVRMISGTSKSDCFHKSK